MRLSEEKQDQICAQFLEMMRRLDAHLASQVCYRRSNPMHRPTQCATELPRAARSVTWLSRWHVASSVGSTRHGCQRALHLRVHDLNLLRCAPQKALPLLFSAQMRPVPGGPHSPDLASAPRAIDQIQQIPELLLNGSPCQSAGAE